MKTIIGFMLLSAAVFAKNPFDLEVMKRYSSIYSVVDVAQYKEETLYITVDGIDNINPFIDDISKLVSEYGYNVKFNIIIKFATSDVDFICITINRVALMEYLNNMITIDRYVGLCTITYSTCNR